VVGSCDHDNEPSGSIKRREFLDYLSDYQLLNLCSFLATNSNKILSLICYYIWHLLTVQIPQVKLVMYCQVIRGLDNICFFLYHRKSFRLLLIGAAVSSTLC
jgi:hypothetical protein